MEELTEHIQSVQKGNGGEMPTLTEQVMIELMLDIREMLVPFFTEQKLEPIVLKKGESSPVIEPEE